MGNDNLLSISENTDLTGSYKKLLFMSTIAISKLDFQEVNGTVIQSLTFYKGMSVPF
jgi:hypothetical protein